MELAATRSLQVDASTRTKPKNLFRLYDWEYLERSMHRLLAGWGRNFCEWDDKTAVHRHVWQTSECVKRLRKRISEFPGGNLDVPVSLRLETFANTVLLAPTFEDALDGIYQEFAGALIHSYLMYIRSAHAIHDAPTIAILQEILTIKEEQRLWFRSYRRKNPHTTDAAYLGKIRDQVNALGQLLEAFPWREGEDKAQAAGVRTDFRLRNKVGQPKNSERKHDIFPYLQTEFTCSAEARRLFWCYGYMLERNLADDQLAWIYDGHFMPWGFHEDVSRHMWDESRHGDSGHSRLLDFGITIQDIGYAPYENPDLAQPDRKPLTPAELYERVFFIGMVAETGHFHVKREAYEDFKEAGDYESAEMMLFDIVDESTHVQYAHAWLPVLAERGAVAEHSSYRARAAKVREEKQAALLANVAQYKKELVFDESQNPDYAFYRKLLRTMQEKKPLAVRSPEPELSPLPM